MSLRLIDRNAAGPVLIHAAGPAVIGLILAQMISIGFFVSALALWVMGVIYNIPPVRSKDLPYLDVLTRVDQ